MRLLALCTLVFAACSAPTSAGPDASNAVVRYPAVPFSGGPTLTNARVQLVSYAGDARAADLETFLDALVTSRWLPRTAGEYGVVAVTRAPSIVLAQTAPTLLDATDVRADVAGWLKDGTLKADASTVFVVLLPDGTALTRFGGNACKSNPGSGLHDATDDSGAGQPFIALPSCPPRFSAFLERTDSMELDLARLLVDTLADPSPRAEPGYQLNDVSSPWTALGTEPGDFCWGRLVVENGFHLQRVWSNAAAKAGEEPCVPASGSAFGVTVSPAVLQSMSVAAPMTFTVTGWSNATVDDWSLSALPWVGDFPITVTIDRTTLNAGLTAQLSVGVPYEQTAGTFGAAMVRASLNDEIVQWPVTFIVR